MSKRDLTPAGKLALKQSRKLPSWETLGRWDTGRARNAQTRNDFESLRTTSTAGEYWLNLSLQSFIL
jgi:hypothetical protein